MSYISVYGALVSDEEVLKGEELYIREFGLGILLRL